MSALLERRAPGSRSWLEEHTHQWVEEGVVSEEQAAEILRVETAASATPLSGPPELPLLAELAAYLGSILALAGGVAVVSRSWDALGPVGRLGIGVLVTVVGFVAAWAVLRLHGAGAQRLGGFLRLIGSGGVALVAGVLAVELGSDSPDVTAMVVGSAVAAVGLGLWRNLDRPLQLVTLVAGVVTFTIGFAAAVGIGPWPIGMVLWAVALGVGGLGAQGRLHPELWVLPLAGVGMMVGAAMQLDLLGDPAFALSLLTAGVVVAAGLALHHIPLTVVGVLGFLQSLQALLVIYLSGSLAGVMVLAVGITMVVAVIVVSVRRGARPPTG